MVAALIWKVARKSDHPLYHIGAIVLSHGRPIAFGYNQQKSHPLALHCGYHAIHAEWDALRKAVKGDTLVVLRISARSGNLGLAKPCARCMEFARAKGIKRIFYTGTDGNFVELVICSSVRKEVVCVIAPSDDISCSP